MTTPTGPTRDERVETLVRRFRRLYAAYQFRFFRRPEVRKLFAFRGDLVF